MKSTLFLALFFFVHLSQAQQIRQILDGNVFHCPPKVDQRASSKQVQIALLGVQKFSDRTEVRLRVRLVQCENGTWQIDQNPTLSTSAEYKNFELMAVDSNSNILFQKNLSELEQTGTQEVVVTLSNSKIEKLEVFVRVFESVQTPDIGKETSLIAFGSYFVNLGQGK